MRLTTPELISRARHVADHRVEQDAPGAPVSAEAKLLRALADRLEQVTHQLHMATFQEDMGR